MTDCISNEHHGLLPMLAAAVLLGAVSATAATPDLAAVEIETTPLSERIYLLVSEPPEAGNLAVSAGEDGIMLVDDTMMPITPRLKAAIAKIQQGEIAFVINTHYHFDHAGGNAAFGEEATIVAHGNVRKRLEEGRQWGSEFIEGARPAAALPVITFDESVTFHWNNETVDVIHFPNPSHTDGDSVIFFRDSNVMHTGDQYIKLSGFPYIDQDVGGSPTGLRDNLAKMLELVDDETTIIPGHGPLARKAEMQSFHDVVAETIAYIEGEKHAGKTVEQIQSAGLPGKSEEVVGKGGFIPEAAWIQTVYTNLDP